ncbi:precorrin-8X methylmutase [Bartonella sp. LJL80]
MFDYIKDGQEIYRQSFATIRSEANLKRFSPDIEKLAVRVIHACGMVDIVEDIAFSKGAGLVGKNALIEGGAILCDAKMVSEGITKRRLPANNRVICTLQEPEVQARAQSIGNTRSAAAVELWEPYIKGAVVAIGNAPTALFHLLNLIEQGFEKPALIIGFPVGFIGAAESKIALENNTFDIPYIVVHGRRGGSAMAVAAINALASEKE